MLTHDEEKRLRDKIKAGGWEALDANQVAMLTAYQRKQVDLQRRQQSAIVKAMAATPEGKRFLQEFLRPRTIEARLSAAEAAPASADLYSLAAARRDGRNSIWWAIHEALVDGQAEPVVPSKEG